MTARIAIIAACLAAAAVAIGHASQTEKVPPRAAFSTFPVDISGWSGEPAAPFDPDVLRVLAVDDYVNRVYTASGRLSVGLYVGYYRSQRQGDTIHSPLNCLPGSGWEPVHKARVALPIGDGTAATVNQIEIQKGLDRQIVLYWYQSHGRVIASEYLGRAYMALDAVRLNRTDGALVRVVVAIDDRAPAGEAAAIFAAHRFAQALFPFLPRYLPE
jgi:EpsI family protein